MDYEFKKQICDMWKNHIVYLDPTSGISQNIPNQHFLTVNINSHGFRGPEIFIEKPDDTYRNKKKQERLNEITTNRKFRRTNKYTI